MYENYGSDFITIEDEDGTQFELEILSTVEYNGFTYYAVIPCDDTQGLKLEVSILKSVEEDDEPILCVIEDEQEFEAVNNLIMDILYEESDSNGD